MDQYLIDNKAEIIEKIEGYLQENKQEIVDALLSLMRIPSVEGEAQEGMPYGKACDDMLNATAALMESHGFTTVKKNASGYTFSLLEGSTDKRIGTYAHGDVVPVDGEWLICPPFEPIIKDGFIFGRGCNDDKSGIVEMLYVAKIIRDLGLPLKSNLLMFTGVNEETGMGDIQAFVKEQPMPDAGLVIDGGSYPCDLGERTFYRFFLRSKTPFESIRAFEGGKVFNIVLPEVKALLPYSAESLREIKALTEGKERFEVSLEEEDIRIIAKGKAAPITHPDGGENAGLAMMTLLLQCACVSDGDKAILKRAQALLIDSYGKGFGIEHTDSRFGRLTIGNGIIRLVEGKIELSFDARVGTEFTEEALKSQVKSVVAPDWTYEENCYSQGYLVAEDNLYRLALARGYRFVEGEDAPLKGDLMSGGTHARHLKNAFPITNMIKRLVPDYPMPQGHGSYHQPDEKLHVDAFVESIKILVFMLLSLDEQVNK